MVKLKKVWVAWFLAQRKPFASEKIVANSYDEAMDLAEEWANFKYPGRWKEIKVEKSKGEILAYN